MALKQVIISGRVSNLIRRITSSNMLDEATHLEINAKFSKVDEGPHTLLLTEVVVINSAHFSLVSIILLKK